MTAVLTDAQRDGLALGQVRKFTDTEKWCPSCEKWLLHSAFYVSRAAPSGLAAHCRPCSRERAKQWGKDNPDRVRSNNRRNHFRAKYGIDEDVYDSMFRAQGAACAICRRRPLLHGVGTLHVDHDHATGRVRGLLCQGCNHMVGHARDSADVLERGAKYLRKQT